MNALCYKIVFSKRLGALVAVGEHTTGQGKAAGTGVRTAVYPSSTGSSPSNFVGLLKSISASVALSFVTTGMATAAGPAVNTLPTAYSINSGNVAISSTSSATNAAMTIKQTTDKASVNWQSFSIGSGAAVNIQQNSSNSVLLNRVVGNDPSQIFGKLTANGQVILINPNGIVFGKGGSVTASAFTASTFGLSDQDFANGKFNYTRNGSSTGVTVEDGATISTTAPAGYVALIGASVDNQGNISTKQGAVVLVAGESVALPTAMTDNISVPLSGKVRLELLPSTINAMVSNSGAITTEGGQVLMQAASLSDAVASITMGGRIDTTAPQAGAVTLLADSGQIKVSGSITANSTNASNTGGDIIIGRDEVTGALAKNTDVSGAKLESLGGFIETSGHQLTVDGITVKAANWLLDPDNIDITTDAAAPTSGYSKIKASDINAALQTTNVTISTSSGVTTSGSVSYVPTNPGDGNIIVSAPIVKTGSADTSLTLNADNSITVNGRIGKASGDGTTTGKLNVTLTAKGIAAAAANSGGITVNNMIDANGGAVTLTGTNQNSGAGAGVKFGGFSGITAGSYKVEGTKLGTAGNGYGVWFTGASTLSSSGTSLINGVSHSATGAFTAGLMFDNSTTVTLDAGAGSLVAKGSNTAFQTGVRISANGPSTTSVTTKGNVTLGSNDSASTGFTLRSGVLTADSGALTILGKTSYGLHGVSVHDSTASMTSNNGASITINGSASANGWNGVNISGASINAGTTGDISIIGNAANGNGVYTDGGTNLSGKNIAIDGTATTTTSGIGVRLNRTGTTNINANNDLLITGTVKGTGTGNGVHSGGSNVGTAILMTAGGKAIIKGIQSGNANNTSNTVYLSGVRLNTTGDLTIQAEAANSNSLAINMSWETGSLNGYDDSQRMQFRSTSGNVLIQSSQGAIVAAERNNVNISGVNVMLDNTGGNINTSTGAITLGSGTSTYSATVGNGFAGTWVPLGVSLGGQDSSKSITATGNLTIGGSSSVTRGVAVGSAVSVGGNINIAGRSSAASTNGLDISSTLTAGGNINLKGESTNATPGVGVNIGSEVKTTAAASSTSITSTGGAVSGSGKITTLAGNSGAITVNTATNGTLSGVISGGGSLVKQGAGTTTLTGSNTYTGTTTISTGTLQIGNGSITGTLGTGAVSMADGANLAFNRSNSITVGNAITGTTPGLGTLNQIGSGTTILTGTNTYGATRISAGTLQVGNGSTTGTLGTGAVENNSILTFNRSNALTMDGAISGTGSVNQTGTGTTTLAADNSYQGATTVSGGTLQIGNAGATGTLGNGGAVTLSNGANLNFVRSANTSIDNTISGNGNVNATITGTGSTLALNNTITLSGATGLQTNNAILSTTGSITQAAGKTLAAKNLYMTASSGSIGASGQRINTNVDNLSLNSAGSQFVTEANAVTVSAQTTGTGSIDVETTNGTLNAGGTVNGIAGVKAQGNVKLTGNNGGSSGHGLALSGTVSATGDVYLIGTTASTTNLSEAGVLSSANVDGKNIYIVGNATVDASANKVLGYRGAGGTFTATEKLDFTGNTNSSANGFYTYQNNFNARTGITISGTSKYGQGVGFDNDVQLTNTTGNIQITGTATDTSKQAIGLQGSSITNNGGDIVLTAASGNIYAGTGGVNINGTSVWGGAPRTNTISSYGTGKVQITAGNGSAASSDAIDGTILSITQNGNGGVIVSTSGTGHVTAPKITNAGTGNVVLAAGSAIAAGSGAGGQVKTVSGNTVTESGTGKTLVFTGTLAETGPLKNLDDNLENLYASDVGSNKRNLSGNKAYASGYSISGGAQAQAIFRQAIDLGTVDFSATVTKTYGDAGYTQIALQGGASQLKTDLGTALAGASDTAITISGAANTIKFNKSTLIQQMALSSSEWNTAANFSSTGYRNASTGTFTVNTASSDFTVAQSITTSNTVTITQKTLTATYAANNKVFDGSTNAIVAGVLKDAIAGDSVTPNHTSATFDSADVGTNKTVTASGLSLSGKDATNYKLDPVVNTGNKATTKANITAVVPTPPAPSIPKNNASIVKIPTGSSNPFALASAEDLTDETCSANNIESCQCEESSASEGVSICYQPKAGAAAVIR